jgi:signal-transduction protein with cAMP-binding, CBS, and nucleotidyltransferase domain
MQQMLKEIMTPHPVSCPATATLADAAAQMAQQDIGDVVVMDDSSGTVCGVVTDRDIVVRALAKGMDPTTTKLGDICTRDLVTLGPNDTAADAVSLMRTHSVRRIPVMENGQAVGMVSLGDLAVDRDPESALADISRAPATV